VSWTYLFVSNAVIHVVNSAFECFRSSVVGNIPDVSEAHTASIFRVEVSVVLCWLLAWLTLRP
jgi:hypothetical protein